ncbi:MAG: serine hydrolase [Candidatus Bathyarchaeota archaeon]|nr:serine hydrolase [Candidatus Bathyarchaeota archaeon]
MRIVWEIRSGVELEMGEVKRIPLPVIGVSLLIIGIVTIYFGNQYLQTYRPNPEAPVFSYASPESQGISNESVAELAETVQRYFDEELIVGAELVVIKNRKIVLHEVVGWNDRENEIPMEKNTLFNIRSMTKPITGAAIQILIDEGRLRLDSRAAEYLPGFDNDDSRNITIEQLLTHRSGLPLSIITAADEYETLYSMANEIGIIGPEFEPGSKFWYSDAGTEVLGAIVEVETGVPLDAFVTEHILEPLRMNNSFYYHSATQNDSQRDRIADLYVGGVSEWVKAWSSEEPLYPFAFGSQSLYSTPVDYARFLAMWMDDGRVGGEQLLSSEAVSRTLTPVSKMSSLGSDMPYPTGFFNLEAYYGQMAILFSNSTTGISEVEVIGHSGSDGTYAWAWPELDLMILYFTQSRGSTSGIKLESRIDELLIHSELTELNSRAREQYARYLGSYTANFGPFRNTEFIVTIQNGALAVDIPNQLVFELDKPDEEGKWHFKLIDEIAVSFELDDHGNVTAMKLHEAGYINELPRGPPPQEESYPDDMERYVGVYQTEDPNVTMKVVILNGRLALDIPGQPIELELYPPDEEGKWYMRVNPTIAVSFNETDDGRIDSLTLHLPDGTTYTRKRIGD